MQPEELLDDETWALISSVLPRTQNSPKGGGQWVCDRDCLLGIIWVLLTGGWWQQIPKRFPSGSTCWRRMMKWSGEGVFETVLELLVQRAASHDTSRELFLDATFVRAKRGATKLAIPSAARE